MAAVAHPPGPLPSGPSNIPRPASSSSNKHADRGRSADKAAPTVKVEEAREDKDDGVVFPHPCPNPLNKTDTISSALPTSIPFHNYGSTLLAPSRPSSTLSSTPSILDADLLPTAAINNLITAQSPSANDGAGSPSNPQRPPIRPAAGVRSKFDLEHNPFEQSFSRSSHHSSSSERTTPPRGGDATSIKHNALPPLSSLTSPAAADPSQFPWLANQSLRTGPLSPAMLAGPQQQGANQPHNPSGLRNGTNEAAPSADAGFDSSTFRTGFTPGTGSGFTPAYNTLMGGNFSNLPLPSPNTAAFLNMVTNATPIGEGGDGGNANVQGGIDQQHTGQPPSAIPPHLQQHHGLSHLAPQPDMAQDTITPNTLSALTGVFNDMNRANQAGQAPPPPPNFFQPMHPHPGQPQPQPQHLGPGMPPQVDYAQQSANAASQAANGLFLLSQAHQELSKREEEQVRGGPGPHGHGHGHGQGKRASGLAHPVPVPGVAAVQVPGVGPGTSKPLNGSVAGQKRKSDGGPKPPGAKKGKKGAAGNPTSPIKTDKGTGESMSPGDMMDSDDDEDTKPSNGGKPETEEDKRKNFLERNRQAALKCRQRKKAWLGELQTKVESLTIDNDRMQQTIAGLHEEVGRLTSILMQHRDCGLGIPTGYGRPIR